MSAFSGRLAVAELDADMLRWELVAPLSWEVGHVGSGRAITVPAGFVTDFASIPWPITAVLPRWGRWGSVAVFHDYMLVRLRGEPHPLALTRKAVDDLFYEALIASGV